jgi:tetratricopeptide (TPR) repeat protein
MKTTRTLLFLCLLGISSLAESQLPPPPPPPPSPPPSGSAKISKADSLIYEGNIKEATAEYRKMLQANPGDSRIMYNYACALSRNNQVDSSLKYLNKIVLINPTTRPLTDPDLLTIRSDRRWNDFENNLIAAINKKSGNPIKDVDYAKALWRLQCMDQYCFYETGIAARKLGPDSPVVAALRKLQTMVNEKNLKELESLLAQKDWPKISEVGPEAAGAAFFVLQHSNAEAQQKYISMFERRCREKEANCQQYALMFDRMRMNQNKPQRYGTHSYLDPSKGRTDELYPLEDPSKVDEWRKEIGLEPLKDYLARTGIKYNPSQSGKK